MTTSRALTTDGVSESSDINSKNPHYLARTHHGKIRIGISSPSSSTSTRQNGSRCCEKSRGCQQTLAWSQFNVAANGHDYLGVTARCNDTGHDVNMVTGLSSKNMVPHGENWVDLKNTTTQLKKLGTEHLPNASSSGLVLRKEKNQSWSVKLKECSSAPSVKSPEPNSCNGFGGNEGTTSSKLDHVNTSGKQTSPCKCCGVNNNSNIVKHVPAVFAIPSCTNGDSNSVKDKGKLRTKIRIKDVNGNDPLVQMVPHNVKESSTGAKIGTKRDKDKSALDGTNAVRKSATIINGKYWNGKDLLLEGREEVEEAAYKALEASTIELPKTNKSVKNAEKEIAHALEIIQLQLKVLQTHKKQSKSGTGIKSGKVTKKGKTPSAGKSSQSVKKRRRSWEPNYTIRFADFFQLPPSLIVKDGDLYPACSMRADPCCPPGPNHPIWRWRLGKTPLPRPPARHLSVENNSEGTSR
ncbi:uncharacterized protein [Amphiura filiformis]|uniref:uncharacterized protein n=1 Tax=Amphiura filiformis TaxID=82378 RepID=UPI003B21EFB0